MSHPDLRSRARGCLLGLACVDAVGTTVEFQPRGSFEPVNDMVGGGPFGLAAGQWTDDTSMALCLADSLLAQRAFDARDQMGRYLTWWRHGYRSSIGNCFDIGGMVAAALRRFEENGDPFAGSSDPATAGNGSLMRLAPAVLFGYPGLSEAQRWAVESSRTTHAAPEVLECCRLFAAVLCRALKGEGKEAVLLGGCERLRQPAVTRLAEGAYASRARAAIAGTGYAVASLVAALWWFWRTDGFREAVLEAANLGDDADTTAVIAGQLAGAFYGEEDIPPAWRRRLHLGHEIAALAEQLLELQPP